MVRMQPYVHMFYDYLNQGKIMGLKCKRCGAYVFPPVAVCDKCGFTDLTWVEMSGEGKLKSFSICTPEAQNVRFNDYAPFAYGTVKLKEGPLFSAMLFGLDIKEPEKIWKSLPIDVKAEIKEIVKVKVITFKVS